MAALPFVFWQPRISTGGQVRLSCGVELPLVIGPGKPHGLDALSALLLQPQVPIDGLLALLVRRETTTVLDVDDDAARTVACPRKFIRSGVLDCRYPIPAYCGVANLGLLAGVGAGAAKRHQLLVCLPALVDIDASGHDGIGR